MASSRTPRLASSAPPAEGCSARGAAAEAASSRAAASRTRRFDMILAPFWSASLERRRSLIELGDLRPLDADAGHQPLLIEDERIDVLRDRRAGERPGEARIDDHDARTDAEFEAAAPVEIGQRLVVHEEERIAEALDAGLEPVGRRHRVVVAGDLAVLLEHPVADLGSEHEAGLVDAREDENAPGLLAEEPGRGVRGVEA